MWRDSWHKNVSIKAARSGQSVANSSRTTVLSMLLNAPVQSSCNTAESGSESIKQCMLLPSFSMAAGRTGISLYAMPPYTLPLCGARWRERLLAAPCFSSLCAGARLGPWPGLRRRLDFAGTSQSRRSIAGVFGSHLCRRGIVAGARRNSPRYRPRRLWAVHVLSLQFASARDCGISFEFVDPPVVRWLLICGAQELFDLPSRVVVSWQDPV
eukprot:gene4512-biopygen6949